MHRVMMAAWACLALASAYLQGWKVSDFPIFLLGGLVGVWSLSFVQRIFGEHG